MAAPVLASFTSETNFGSGITLNAPTGITSGDSLFIAVMLNDANGFTSVPAGWTVVYNNTEASPLWTIYLTKVSDGTEGDITLTAASGSNEPISGVYGRVTGASATLIHSAPSFSGFSDTWTVESATATDADTLALIFAGQNDNSATTFPAAYTVDVTATQGAATLEIASDVIGAGATGTDTITAAAREKYWAIRTLFTPTASGGSTADIALGGGSTSSEGYAPTTTAGQSASVTLGSTETATDGYAVETTAGRTAAINLGSGSTAIEGYAPSTTFAQTASVELQGGTTTSEGYATSAAAGQIASIDLGSASTASTGYAPTVTASISANVSLQSGTTTSEGYAIEATGSVSASISLQSGYSATTGYPVSFAEIDPNLVVETPAERTLTIAAQDRTSRVAYTSRSTAVPAASRIMKAG